MMRRTLANTIVAAALLILGSTWTTSKSAAEPLSGSKQEVPAESATPSVIPPAAEPATQAPELTEAETLFQKRDFTGALAALKKAVTKDPNLPPAQVLMASMFFQAKALPEARNALDQAVVDAPTDPQAYVLMGDLALRERRITEAQMLFQKASELMGEFNKSAKRKETLQPVIFRGLAEVAENRGDWTGRRNSLKPG